MQKLKLAGTFLSEFRKIRKKLKETQDSGKNSQKLNATLQSVMDTKLSKQKFWHCYENRLIKTIKTIPYNL